MVLRESRTQHEIQGKGLLVGLQLLLRARLTDYYILPNLLNVWQKFNVPDGYRETNVMSRLIKPVDKVAGLLEFDRQEKRCRRVDAPNLDTLSVCATRCDLVSPKSQSGTIGLAIEKVQVVLPHKEYCVRIVERIRAVSGIIVGNRYAVCAW